MGDALRVGIVGLGTISGQYLDTLGRLPEVEVAATADQDPSRAAMTPAELYATDIEVVLNLTPPTAHAPVALAAIAAGKHVYGEKPIAVSTVEAQSVLTAAASAGVRVACAPDTVLGTGIQTARQVIDAGSVGTRWRRRRSWSRRATNAGTRNPSSTTNRAAARCWTWARTTCRRW